MHVLASSSDIALGICFRSKIASPETLSIVCIWEHVVVLSWPSNLLIPIRGNCINVLGWSGVLKLYILVFVVECKDELIKRAEVLMSIAPSEIISEELK